MRIADCGPARRSLGEGGLRIERRTGACVGAVLLAALCALLVGGCESGLPEDIAKLAYVNRAERFAMDAPAGWTVRESGGAADVLVMAPAADGQVRPNVNVVVHKGAAPLLSLHQEVTAARESLNRMPGFRLIAEGPTTTADGRAAWTATFVQEALGRPVEQRQLYVVAGQKTYLVTATASPETFAYEEPNFDVCFRSFRAAW